MMWNLESWIGWLVGWFTLDLGPGRPMWRLSSGQDSSRLIDSIQQPGLYASDLMIQCSTQSSPPPPAAAPAAAPSVDEPTSVAVPVLPIASALAASDPSLAL